MKRNSLLLNKNHSVKVENYKLVILNFYFIKDRNLMNFYFPILIFILMYLLKEPIKKFIIFIALNYAINLKVILYF